MQVWEFAYIKFIYGLAWQKITLRGGSANSEAERAGEWEV